MKSIELNGLTKKFKERTAVDHVTLDIEKGEVFGLLGQNGAGKTTTIKMLSCLLAPSEGDAKLCGHSITTDSENVKKIINVSPQETAIAPKLSVKENLELIAEVYGMDSKTAKSKAEEMMHIFNLTERANDRAKKLSGGMQRKLSIAMAMITQPEILFLDEPTLGLDVRARRELWKTVEKLKGDITVILTTHYLEEAEALADRIGIMDKGVLKIVGTADEIKKAAGKDNFEEAFLDLTEDEEYED